MLSFLGLPTIKCEEPKLVTQTEILSHRLYERIYTVRGCQVMLDHDLAEIYGVETRSLKQTVRRNTELFPLDFMFEVTTKEIEFL